MSALGSLRRLAVFALVFGGAMGIVAWQVERHEVPESANGAGGRAAPAPPPDDMVVPISPGASLGSGRGVQVSRDAVEVVGGEPLTYRAYEAAWERQTPLPGGTVDARRLHTETFSVLLFHRRPTEEEPRPPAIEGPDTTRVTADAADLEVLAGSSFSAHLEGDVRVVRHDLEEDLTLRTELLDLRRVEDAQGAEEVHAASTERVYVDGRGTHLEGTGLEADLGIRDRPGGPPGRMTLQRDVQGDLLARRGALTGQGGDDSAPAVPTRITCSGAAVLQELERGAERRPARWLVTFQDDVVVTQEDTRLTCASLEIEFRTTGSKGIDGEPIEVLRAVADGHVIVDGKDVATSQTWRIESERSVTHRDRQGGYDADLEGGTTLAFDGTLRGRGTANEQAGRVEIRCSGPATMHTDPKPPRPGDALRGRISFHEDVTAREWDPSGKLVTEVTAPEVALLGNRLATADTRLDPETLTATGTPEQRVTVTQEGLRANAQAMTWRVVREQDVERLLLTGRPSVRIDDTSGVNLVRDGRAGQKGVLHIDAADAIEMTRQHSPPEEGALAYATVAARKEVVVRSLVDEQEAYRLEAADVDAALDANLQPTAFRAYGSVLLAGRGESGQEIELRGSRLAADAVPGADPQWVRTAVYVFGEPTAAASADIDETAAKGGATRHHRISAEQLRYEEGGTRIVARRDAEVQLDRPGRHDRGTTGQVLVRGGELRALLAPPAGSPDAPPEIVRIEGEGGVSLETTGYLVTGRTMTYDRTTGIAIAEGEPARGILLSGAHGASRDPEKESFVNSEHIQVEFDPTEERPGRPRRVTCRGGTLRYWQAPTDPGAAPSRVTLRASGPIEILRETASAESDVDIAWESRVPGGALQQDARLTCERADIWFVGEGEGDLRDRIRRAVAVGTRARPARLTSPRLDATADRVEAEGDWISLFGSPGRRVDVVRRDPAEAFTCEKGRYNYRTQEFESTRATLRDR